MHVLYCQGGTKLDVVFQIGPKKYQRVENNHFPQPVGLTLAKQNPVCGLLCVKLNVRVRCDSLI